MENKKDNRPVYIVGRMAVKDYTTYFERYGIPFFEILKKYQGSLLASTKQGATLEGDDLGNWTVLASFPSKALALKFWNSPEYAPLKALRINELTNDQEVFLFPALKENNQ